jgi:PAS domain S-box-containing protein
MSPSKHPDRNPRRRATEAGSVHQPESQETTSGDSRPSELRESERRFRATFEQAAVGMAHVGLSGEWLRVNQRLCEIVGYPREELLRLTFQDITFPDDLEADLEHMVRLTDGEIESYSMMKRYVRKGGSLVWINLTGSCVRNSDGSPEYFIAVVEDIDARKRAEESFTFITEAGRLLSASLEVDAVLETLVGLALPRLGDYAVVDLLDESGAIQQCHTAHVLPEKRQLAREYRRRYPPGPRNPKTPIWRAMQTGEPIVARDLPESFVDSVARDAEQARLLRALRPRSFLILPLVTMGRTVGAMSFCISESDRQHSDEDLALAGELASRAAVALENAQLYQKARERLEEVEHARAWTERLQGLTADFVQALRPGEVAAIVTRRVKEVLGAAAGGVLLLTPDQRELEMIYVEGWSESEDLVSPWRRFAAVPGIPVVDAIRTRSLLTIESLSDYRDRYPEIAAVIAAAGYGAYVVIPLEAEDRVIGALNYNFMGDRQLSAEERGFLIALGHLAAQAIQRATLYAAEAEARRTAEELMAEAELATEQAESARQEMERGRDKAREMATSLERLNQKLAQTAAQAEAANQAKSEFLRVMSHELRTPLTAIGAYTEILEMGIHGPVTEAQRNALERIHVSHAHLLGIVNSILDFQSVEAGKVSYAVETVTVGQAMTGLTAIVEPIAQSGEIEFYVEAEPCEIQVEVDPEKLRQILLNLVSNAVKFTVPGGRVWVDCLERGDEVVVRVHDTGIGIPADKLETIFEPFVQLDMGLTRQHGGTGIGLAISREFARGMGGDLSAISEPGRGSVFSLRLPGAHRNRAAQEQVSRSNQRQGRTSTE